MTENIKSSLQQIPGIGKNMEAHLKRLGYDSIESLKGQNPEEMYEREKKTEKGLCRCVLYCYRLAVYYAETKPENRDPEKLKWESWKDKLETYSSKITK